MDGGDFQKGEGGGDFQKRDSFEEMRKLVVGKKMEKAEAERQKVEAERKQFIEASNLFYSYICQFLESFYLNTRDGYIANLSVNINQIGIDQPFRKTAPRYAQWNDLKQKYGHINFIELLKECQTKLKLDGFEFEWKEELDNRWTFPSYLHISCTPQVKSDEVAPYKHRFGFNTEGYLRSMREREIKMREHENKARERARELEIVANELLELGPLFRLLDEKAAKKRGYEPEIFLDSDGREMLASKYHSVNQTIIRAIRIGSSGVTWDYGRAIDFPSGLNKNLRYPTTDTQETSESEGFKIMEVLEKCAEILCENGFQASAYTKPNVSANHLHHHRIQITINHD